MIKDVLLGFLAESFEVGNLARLGGTFEIFERLDIEFQIQLLGSLRTNPSTLVIASMLTGRSALRSS